MRRQSLSNFVDLTKLPKDFLIFDSGGFAYINQAMFPGAFARDVNPTEADIMAIVQKPINQSILAENLVLQHGSNYPHGIRFLGAIT
jgi:hypothetical protein